MMAGDGPRWEEDDSAWFIRYGDAITPGRDEQLAMLCGLVPAGGGDQFSFVELGCGAGRLSAKLLDTFPRSRVLALDGSPVMLDRADRTLQRFPGRYRLEQFLLQSDDWLGLLPPDTRCVLSSLVIHHLDGAGKRHLFAEIEKLLAPGGAFLIADLVEPVNERAWKVYGDAWDATLRAQLIAEGEEEDYKQFLGRDWNFFRVPDLDVDHPSNLLQQLDWLRQAGFSEVDCFWLRAGHAIYGGYKGT